MAKTKAPKPVDGKSSAVMTKGKDGRVVKPTEPVKPKVEPAKGKKSKRAPTPPSESESESESDADSDDDASDASDASSVSESDDNKETKTKVAAPKVNGNAKLTNGDVSSGSESDDEDASDDEAVPPKATKAQEAKGKVAAIAASNDESDSSSASEESESESEEETVAGQTAKAGESDSESDSEGSDDDEEDEAEMPARAVAIEKKRKADAVETPVAKKTKTETESDGPTSLFVGNMSFNIDEEWLKREFEAYGTVLGTRIITDRDSGRPKGFGYVDFEKAEDAAKALEEMKGYELDGRALNVDFNNSRGDKSNSGTPRDRANSRANKFGDATSPASDTLWIGNLPWGTDAETLKQTCEEYGAVASVRIPTDRDTGEIKGFGYVSYGSIDEAKAAQEALAGADFQGRPMRVDFAGPRPERPDGGNVNGFRGGRGGGGGGFRGGRGGGDRGGGFRGGFRGGRGDSRGGGFRGGRGGSTNRGGIGDFSGKKVTF